MEVAPPHAIIRLINIPSLSLLVGFWTPNLSGNYPTYQKSGGKEWCVDQKTGWRVSF